MTSAFFSARVWTFASEGESNKNETSTDATLASGVGSARASFSSSVRSDDFLCRDAKGVQTRYPSVAKIVGRAATKEREDGAQMTPVYYGTGCYVAEFGSWGIVLTNWHVVSESDAAIDVVFPTSGLYPARVILRDEVWDLAALLIERPDELSPIPISLEVPKLGERFWVGGYGQKSGLDDFQLQFGYLQNYVSLVDSGGAETGIPPSGVDAALPSATVNQGVYLRPPPRMKKALYETLSIKRGVRRGDSGGPIFNRYGELAGLLWGSDGKSTMGTIDLRMQEFLTQAIRRAARYCAEQTFDAAEAGLTFDEHTLIDFPLSSVSDAVGTELSMYDALLQDGVFSISSHSVYVSPDGSISAESLASSAKEEALNRVVSAVAANPEPKGPPFPPIYSPTFVVQQRETKQIYPEKIDPVAAVRLNEVVVAQVAQERASRRLARAKDFEIAQAKPPKAKALNVALKSIGEFDDSEDLTSESVEANVSSNDMEKDAERASSVDESEKTLDGEPNEEGASPDGGVYLSKIQTYALFCILFIVFYLAARGMNIESESERKKERKIRLRND